MGAYVTPQELGSRFLRPHDVSGALCSVAAQLGTLQQEHQRLGATNVGCTKVRKMWKYVGKMWIYEC